MKREMVHRTKKLKASISRLAERINRAGRAVITLDNYLRLGQALRDLSPGAECISTIINNVGMKRDIGGKEKLACALQRFTLRYCVRLACLCEDDNQFLHDLERAGCSGRRL